MALIADFMLVWLPAPTLSYAAKRAGKQGRLGSFLASCPDNAFQVRRTHWDMLLPPHGTLVNALRRACRTRW